MRSDRPIATSTPPKMLQYREVAAVPHGFRSSFQDWAAEETDHPREAIEATLAPCRSEHGRGRLCSAGPVACPHRVAPVTIRPLSYRSPRMARVSCGESFLDDKELRLEEDGSVVRYALKGGCRARRVP